LALVWPTSIGYFRPMFPPSAPRRPWQEIAADLSKEGNLQKVLSLMNELGEAFVEQYPVLSSHPIDEGAKKKIT
jgi:hypothetical protein